MRARTKPTLFFTGRLESRRGMWIPIHACCILYVCVPICTYKCVSFLFPCSMCEQLDLSRCLHRLLTLDHAASFPFTVIPKKASARPALGFSSVPWDHTVQHFPSGLSPACWERRKYVCRAWLLGLCQQGYSSQHGLTFCNDGNGLQPLLSNMVVCSQQTLKT